MKLTITINCDNAAFEDNPDELSGLLVRLARKTHEVQVIDLDGLPLFDTNGNRVGGCRVE